MTMPPVLAPDSPARPTPPWTPFAAAGLLVAITLVTFAPTFSNGFVGDWDDRTMIFGNPLLRPGAAGAMWRIWDGPIDGLYAPLSYTTFWALAAAGQAIRGDAFDPRHFHLLSVALHAGGGLLLWTWLRRLDLAIWPACGGAAVWLVHPLQVEAVAWAASLNTVLAGFFGLLALALASRGVTRSGWRRYGGLVASTAAAWACVASKPAGVVLPVLLLIAHPFLLRRPWNETVAWAALWAAAAFPLALVNQDVQSDALVVVPFAWRAAVAAHALGFYVQKTVWPCGLIMAYGLRPDVVIAGRWYVSAGVAAAAGAALWVPRRGRTWRAVGAAVFVVGIAPVLGLVPFYFQSYSTVADRYVYLAMAGPALMIAATLQALAPAAAAVRALAAGGVVLVVLTLAALSARQTTYWHDVVTLSRHAVSVNPDCVPATAYVGFDAQGRGDWAAAERAYRRVIGAVPNQWGVRARLVIVLCHMGRWNEADSEAKRLQRFRPDDADVEAELNGLLARRPTTRAGP